MVEIVFSESAAGSLKSAQHYGDGKFKGVSVGVFATREDGNQLSAGEIEQIKKQAE